MAAWERRGGSRAVAQPAKAQPHHQAGARKATPSASRRLTRLVCETLLAPGGTSSPRLRWRRRRRDARGASALGEPQRRTARREPRPCTVTMRCASRRAIACDVSDVSGARLAGRASADATLAATCFTFVHARPLKYHVTNWHAAATRPAHARCCGWLAPAPGKTATAQAAIWARSSSEARKRRHARGVAFTSSAKE